jgi:hypothetical protein
MFALFGQVGANCESVDSQEIRLSGRTGLSCRLSPWQRAEVVLQGGPSLSCADPLRPVRMQEHSEFLFEVQCRWYLLGPVKLEYSGTATPALAPTEHDRINQDVRFAFPIGAAGQLQLGAKHNWEHLTVPKPLTDSGQLYFGLEMKR